MGNYSWQLKTQALAKRRCCLQEDIMSLDGSLDNIALKGPTGELEYTLNIAIVLN